MYITFEEYSDLYDPMDEKTFDRLVFDACRVMDIHTTGIDNIKKLQQFFPTDEYDSKAVKRCAAEIIHLQHLILQAENTAMESYGFETTEMGMRGKVVSSVTAGNESISYATGNLSATSIDAAVKDQTVKSQMIKNIIWDYLRGVDDANGISLLYMGAYPRRYLC